MKQFNNMTRRFFFAKGSFVIDHEEEKGKDGYNTDT